MSGILILTTGGTIDKVYFDRLSEFQIGDSVVERVLAQARVATSVRVVELMRKDSLDLTETDRAMIVDAIGTAPEQRIVVTHGTDTMTRTAEAIEEVAGKVVVLTGALSPARFAESDAPFNLGMALAAAQLADPGVHITMNGTVFPADRARKDQASNCFVEN